MDTRRLEPLAADVSVIGMGCSRLGAFWQRRSPAEGVRAVQGALDAGINFIDVADVYARGIAERVVGRAVAGREDVVISSKAGFVKTPPALARAEVAALRSGKRSGLGEAVGSLGPALAGMARESSAVQCFEPAYLASALDRSLRRLGSERVDLWLLHSPPLDVIERADFLDVAATAVASGKIGCFGISAPDAESAAAAVSLANDGVSVVQLTHNLLDHSALDEVADSARSAGVALLARAPFADGRVFDAAGADLDSHTISRECLRFSADPRVASVLVGMARPQSVSATVEAWRAGPAPAGTGERILDALEQVGAGAP